MTKAVIEITGDASGLTAAVNQANGQLNTLTQQVQKASQDMADGFGRLRSVGLQVMAALGLADLAKQSLDASMRLEKMATTLRFASGSADEAAKNNEFLRRTVKELGLDLATAGDAFAKLAAAARGTKLEGQGARDVFDAVAKASTAMGLSADQTQGALLAVQQMMSKGKVQSEELRGQLGERLPGAFQIAARAMGVTTEELDKLLEKGMVPAAEFLPRFAAQLRVELGDAAAQAANSLQAALNRMQSAKLEAVAAMQNADLTKAFLGGFTEFLETVPAVLTKSKLDIKSWADEIAMIFAALADVLSLPAAAIDRIGRSAATGAFFGEAIKKGTTGDFEGARKAGDMARSLWESVPSVTPFADQLRSNREFVATDIGPGRTELAAQLAANQRARDLALLATKPTLGSGDGDKDKRDAARNAMEALEAERRFFEEAYKYEQKYYESVDKLAEESARQRERLLDEGIKSEAAAVDARLQRADEAARTEWELRQREERAWRAEFERLGKTVKDGEDYAKRFGLTMSSALEDLILKGTTARGVVQALIQDIARMAIRETVTRPMAGLVGQAVSALGNWAIGAFGSTAPVTSSGWVSAEGGSGYGAGMYGMAPRAVGGYVEAGSLYRVNDGGMGQFEAFRPRVSGEVVPLGAGAGALAPVVNQTINISTGIAQTVRAEIANLMPSLRAMAASAAQDAMQRRGGSYA